MHGGVVSQLRNWCDAFGKLLRAVVIWDMENPIMEKYMVESWWYVGWRKPKQNRFLKSIMEQCSHIHFSSESGTNNIARAIDKLTVN